MGNGQTTPRSKSQTYSKHSRGGASPQKFNYQTDANDKDQKSIFQNSDKTLRYLRSIFLQLKLHLKYISLVQTSYEANIDEFPKIPSYRLSYLVEKTMKKFLKTFVKISEEIMNEFFEDFKSKFDEFKSQKFSTMFNRDVTTLGQSYGLMIKSLTQDAKNAIYSPEKQSRKYSLAQDNSSNLTYDKAQNLFQNEIKEFLNFMDVPQSQFESSQKPGNNRIEDSFDFKIQQIDNKSRKISNSGVMGEDDPSPDRKPFPKFQDKLEPLKVSEYKAKNSFQALESLRDNSQLSPIKHLCKAFSLLNF